MARAKQLYHNKEWLRQKYIDENMSINQIAAFCGVTFEAVRKFLVKFNIPRREKGNPFERGNAWKGGKVIKPNGYVKIWNGKDYDYEHRIVAERMLGRPLREDEIVHHINRDKGDNSPLNLQVIPSQADHARLHGKGIC